MFLGKLGQECPTGYVYDANLPGCVQTYSTTVTDCADPTKVWNELTQQCEPIATGGTGNGMLYLGLGLAALLLLSFAGGRASKKTGSRLVARTTTRSVFA